MKLIITLALLAVSQARLVPPAIDVIDTNVIDFEEDVIKKEEELPQQPECDLVGTNNIGYEKEVLKKNAGEPYQMAIDYNTNILFFSYSVSNPENDEATFKSAYLNLDNNEYNTIPGIKGGFAATVDKNQNKVYLGGRNGIYEYDYATNKATHINPNGYSIWQLFSKDTLYYVGYPQFRAYTFENGNSVMIPELNRTIVLEVAVDNNDNLYFSNSSGLFLLNKADKEIINLGNFKINGFTADIDGNLYFSTNSGLYYIDNEQNVYNIAKIDNVFGLVVDANKNVIYATADEIIRLKASKSC